MTYETPGGTPHLHDFPAPPPPPTPPKNSIGSLGWTALGVAGVAFLLGFVPFLGILLGAAAIVLAIVALVQRRPKWIGIVGLILGSLALLTSLISTIGVSVALSNGSARPASIVETTPDSAPSELEESSSAAPSAAEKNEEIEVTTPATPDLATFGTVDDRTLSLIVKEPDNNIGQNLIVYGTITQLDSATGPCGALISIAEGQKENSFDYEHNTYAISGDAEAVCPVFDPLVEGDHVKIWATVLGSFSYDTQIGGNTSVPALQVWQAELLPELEY